MAVEQSITKACTKCCAVKSVSEFAMRKDRTNSTRSICRKCANELSAQWRKNNPDRQRELSKRWADLNKDKLKTYQETWRERHHKTKIKTEKKTPWRVRNRERHREASRRWREANPDKNRSIVARWRIENPERIRIKNQNYRAKTNGSRGVLSDNVASRLYTLQRGRCACCGVKLGGKFHRDHIMPLALGGANVDSNIQLLCQPCNNKKHAKHPIDFMRSNGFLL